MGGSGADGGTPQQSDLQRPAAVPASTDHATHTRRHLQGHRNLLQFSGTASITSTHLFTVKQDFEQIGGLQSIFLTPL